jgi:post-segregation antitoxin (ccd killing protein)
MVTVTVELDEMLVRQAEAAGLLTSEALNAMLKAEIERRRADAFEKLTKMMDSVAAQMKTEYPDLTDDEAQAMIDQWIAEADEEIAPVVDQQS